MSYDVSITSTPFRLVSAQAPEQVRALIAKHMDFYRVQLDLAIPPANAEAGEYFSLELDGQNAGDSLSERLSALVKAMGPLVTDAFQVTLRNHDDPSDEPNTEYVGGPNQESIDALIAKHASEDAIDVLERGGLAARQAVLDWLLKEPALQVPTPKVAVPHALVEALNEASEILSELTEVTAPHNMRWPLADELQGFALMLGDAKSIGPQEAIENVKSSPTQGDRVHVRFVLNAVLNANGEDPDYLGQRINSRFAPMLNTLTDGTEATIDAVDASTMALSKEAAELHPDQIEAWIRQQIEGGHMELERVPVLMARYALADPALMREEFAERMSGVNDVEQDRAQPTAERPS